MSKSFTATAAMFAAQDGLVDLDESIATYLPDFHVNSIFEEHPEQKITLRMLLSHTAGFVHEAPYGGNYDHPPYSFEKHIASISDTWLKFPVGTRYSYSNLGIDLAGYILQVRSGMPFVRYVQEKVLDPLGMTDSTLDVKRIRSTPTRAIGHSAANPFQPWVDFLLIPSGGVWTTATDMARYLQFHINRGTLGDDLLLRQDLAETMYIPPNVPANHYALGVVRTTDHGTRRFEHGGGGFGFNSNMIWYPELKLGAVVLCNAQLDSDWVVQLNQDILDSIIASASDVYDQRAKSEIPLEPAYPPDTSGTFLSDAALQKMILDKALPEASSAAERRKALIGTYMILGLGETAEIRDRSGWLTISYWGTTETLTEVEPGLYFSPYGDAVDFRGRIPTYSNIRLGKVDRRTGLLYIAFYAACGLVFLSAVFHRPLRTVIRRIRRKRSSWVDAPIQTPPGPWPVWTGSLAALASLLSLLCLALFAFIPDMLTILAYLPWSRPYVDLSGWQFALLSLPFASLSLALVVALLAGPGMKGDAWRGTLRPYYLIVALVLLVFNLTILL
jgi:CubicO group peptidase (beta-lactamase class C family)